MESEIQIIIVYMSLEDIFCSESSLSSFVIFCLYYEYIYHLAIYLSSTCLSSVLFYKVDIILYAFSFI
jgi:hypothetical protein